MAVSGGWPKREREREREYSIKRAIPRHHEEETEGKMGSEIVTMRRRRGWIEKVTAGAGKFSEK